MAENVGNFLAKVGLPPVGTTNNKAATKPQPDALAGGQRALENAKKALTNTQGNIAATTNALMQIGEISLAGMGSAFVEGYVGGEKLNWGGMDVRTPLGVGSVAKGVYDLLQGHSSGSHWLNAGTGVLLPSLIDSARKAGGDMARPKNQQNAQKTQPPAQPVAKNEAQLPGDALVRVPFTDQLLPYPPNVEFRPQPAQPQPAQSQQRQTIPVGVTPGAAPMVNGMMLSAEHETPSTREVKLPKPKGVQSGWTRLDDLLPNV